MWEKKLQTPKQKFVKQHVFLYLYPKDTYLQVKDTYLQAKDIYLQPKDRLFLGSSLFLPADFSILLSGYRSFLPLSA